MAAAAGPFLSEVLPWLKSAGSSGHYAVVSVWSWLHREASDLYRFTLW